MISALAGAALPAFAQGGGADFFEIEPSITRNTINLPTGQLDYTATAAQIPLRNSDGDVECRMFYVAYTKDGAAPGTRPITFAFNGGPGSATLWLHMGSLGPMMPPMPDDGSLPKPPYAPIPNPDTWLDFTDVVCVDAPGTGYSRIARPDLASRYFGVRPDINAFTNFVREFLKEHNRWTSPIFIAGESYGGIRGSGLCASLFDAGIAVNGFISISGTNSYLTLDGARGNNVKYTSFFPTLSATAWYHKKLSPRFRTVEALVEEVTKWVENEYVVALHKGDSLTAAEKDRVAGKMAEYLGVSKEYCLGSNLRVPEFAFFRELLRDEGLMIGRLDGRITGKEEQKEGDRGSGDPSDDAITPPYVASVNPYLTQTLKVETDMPYLTYGSVRPWSEPEGSYAETASDLRRVIARNPHFRVLYTCGYYDIACPFYGTIYMVNQMGLDEESRKQISYAYYPAGHMMYTEKGSRKKFHDDVRDFVRDCLRG